MTIDASSELIQKDLFGNDQTVQESREQKLVRNFEQDLIIQEKEEKIEQLSEEIKILKSEVKGLKIQKLQIVIDLIVEKGTKEYVALGNITDSEPLDDTELPTDEELASFEDLAKEEEIEYPTDDSDPEFNDSHDETILPGEELISKLSLVGSEKPDHWILEEYSSFKQKGILAKKSVPVVGKFYDLPKKLIEEDGFDMLEVKEVTIIETPKGGEAYKVRGIFKSSEEAVLLDQVAPF